MGIEMVGGSHSACWNPDKWMSAVVYEIKDILSLMQRNLSSFRFQWIARNVRSSNGLVRL
ncbi:hypothetical protein RvY_15839 [Ramazzottius varieornatus]|uniref:Uncharacterized protein n=1 Tax=Ramazzottius varieornatus TaxID=947166 RepID=A0A1D1W461_RAMVA|nr:hypothetical protein RvY_15839 [Ramazzottius varieornatus]